MNSHCKAGFTLLEITMVIVIIALLMGGILIGSDLIRSAEIRSAMRQMEMLDTSINAFRGKYNCLPGDCKNITQFGFTASAAPGTMNPLTTFDPSFIAAAYAGGAPPVIDDSPVVEEEGSLNGDGDSKIDSSQEYLNTLRLLSQAGLLDDRNPTTGYLYVDLNSAVSLSGQKAFWFLNYLMPITNSSVNIESHYYWITGNVTAGNTGAATLLPKTAFAIDVKKDDGFPRDGSIQATGNNATPNPITSGPIFDPDADAGASGATSNYCVTDDEPNQYNVSNESSSAGVLCTLTAKANI
jgi:prepilin-type N-terminal cleavage/methylation domain-containing protein